MDGYRREFEERLTKLGAEVVSAGLVDTVESGRRAGEFFAERHVDLVLCFMSTYVQSAFVLPVAQRCGAFMALVGLQPTAGLNMSSATIYHQLLHDNCTSLPETVYAMQRAGLETDVVFGMLYDDGVWRRIDEWVRAARAARGLRNARIGLMGHPFEGMLDMNADPSAFDSTLGMHVDMIEMCDFKKRVDAVTPAEAARMVGRIQDAFSFPDPGPDTCASRVTPEALQWPARVAVGLERLVADCRLDGLAYYYRGADGNSYESLIAGIIVGASFLTGRGVPLAGEGDLKNCVAMLMMDRIGAGGSFCELHPADLEEDFILIGHDGPGHIAITDQKPILRDLSFYHGKFGQGVSVEFKIKHGPLTIAGLTLGTDNRFKFVTAEGESVPGAIPATGNTNTRARFPPDTVTFVERWSMSGSTHHFALGTGHQVSTIRKLGKILGLPVEVFSGPAGQDPR
jgi:L-arabinose isomerase